jgi:hypothetical protein
MFDAILTTPELFSIRRETCEENNIGIELSDKLLETNNFIILKIDAYYNSKRMHNPPRAIDCFIMVKCIKNECYDFYLIELKNVKKFDCKEIEDKFRTAVDFIEKEFAKIFNNYCLNRAYFYFVSDVLRLKKYGFTEEQYRKKIKGTKLDYLQNTIFQFRGKIVYISPELPEPMVKEC